MARDHPSDRFDYECPGKSEHRTIANGEQRKNNTTITPPTVGIYYNPEHAVMLKDAQFLLALRLPPIQIENPSSMGILRLYLARIMAILPRFKLFLNSLLDTGRKSAFLKTIFRVKTKKLLSIYTTFTFSRLIRFESRHFIFGN